MSGQNIGYIRVSSEGQNTVRQLEGIQLDKKFEDKVSGSTKARPNLDACLNYLRDGDILHVHSIDRLARNLRDLQEILDGLIVKGVSIKFHTENLIFSGHENPMDKLMLQMMGSFAEFERSISKNRQREGIDAAKKAGKHLGRPRLDGSLSSEAKKLKAEGLSIVEIGKRLSLSRPSVYKLLA